MDGGLFWDSLVTEVRYRNGAYQKAKKKITQSRCHANKKTFLREMRVKRWVWIE